MIAGSPCSSMQHKPTNDIHAQEGLGGESWGNGQNSEEGTSLDTVHGLELLLLGGSVDAICNFTNGANCAWRLGFPALS